MLLGAAWGLILVGVWELTYRLTWARLFHWVVPAAACAAATAGVAYRQGFLALTETVAGRRRWLSWAALPAAAAAWAAILNYAVRYWNPDWPTQLPPAAAWLWPRALYRAMLLAPVWGSWAMLVLPQFHRPDAGTDAHTRALAEKTSPLSAAAYLAVPLAGSFVYLMFLWPPFRFLPPAAAVLAAVGAGSVIVRVRGGLCREALLAANVVTQAGFLLAYLAVR